MRCRKLCCMFLGVMLLFCSVTFGATKYDVITAINKTYQVGKEKYRLPQKIIDKGTNYLNKNELTEAQYDNILNCIDKAVALAREVGTTDIRKVSKEDLRRALEILREASSAANVNFDEKLAENNITIPSAIEDVEDDIKLPVESKKDVVPIDETHNGENMSLTVDKIEKNDNVGESVENIIAGELKKEEDSAIVDKVVDSQLVQNDVNDSIDEKNADKLITFGMIVLIGILMIFILMLLLILKLKCNKILRYVLVIIFSILIFILFCVIVGVIYYIEELKLIYEIYNMFN